MLIDVTQVQASDFICWILLLHIYFLRNTEYDTCRRDTVAVVLCGMAIVQIIILFTPA